MKKIVLSAVALTVLAVTSVKAQIKEGYILYDMKIEGLPPEQAAMIGDMETKVTFKNGKSLTEVNSMMFSQQASSDENGVVMLMEQMGNKMAIKQTKAEIEKEESKNKMADPKIEYINESKTVAGYECKKAIVTILDKDKKEIKTEMWYSDKFENPNKEGRGRGQGIMKGLKGVPLEYSSSMGAMKVKMVAKEISTDPVSDAKFVLSTDGYKLMTMDELKALQGGGK